MGCFRCHSEAFRMGFISEDTPETQNNTKNNQLNLESPVAATRFVYKRNSKRHYTFTCNHTLLLPICCGQYLITTPEFRHAIRAEIVLSDSRSVLTPSFSDTIPTSVCASLHPIFGPLQPEHQHKNILGLSMVAGILGFPIVF